MKITHKFLHIFIVLALVILAVSFTPPVMVNAQSTTLSITPATGTAMTCDDYIITVRVADVTDLNAYDISLQFTSSIPGGIEVLEVMNGGFLDFGSWVIPVSINNSTGVVRAVMTQTNATGKTGDGDLLKIRVRSLQPGVTVNVSIITSGATPTKLSALNGVPIPIAQVFGGSFTTTDDCPFTMHAYVDPPEMGICDDVDSFTIYVKVRYAVDLWSYSLQLSFDPGSIRILSVENGDFLTDGILEPTNSFNNTTGTISWGMTQQDTPTNPVEPKTGSGSLIKITGYVRDLDPQTVHMNILDTSKLLYWNYVTDPPGGPGAPEPAVFTNADGIMRLYYCSPTAVTSVSLTTDSLKEQMPVGTEIGTLVAEGLHPSEFYTYTLVDRLNYPDNNAFTISGNKLLSAEVFNASVKNTYTIKVNAFMDIEPRDESIDEVLTVSIKPAQTFSDVPVPEWSWQYIENIFARGITTGCALNPLRYCPDRAVTRGEMAVFILRALNVDALAYYAPGEGAANPFVDVPAAGKLWMEPWIAQFYKDELTTGCAVNPMRYCPERSVTRAEMAVFLLRARGIAPVDDGINPFVDVPVPGKEWMEPWIVTFYNEGYTTGCGTSGDKLMYCPERSVTRAEMAAFLDRVFLEEPAP